MFKFIFQIVYTIAFFYVAYLFIFQGVEFFGWDFDRVKDIVTDFVSQKAEEEVEKKTEEVLDNLSI